MSFRSREKTNAGSTYADEDGMYDPQRNTVVIAERTNAGLSHRVAGGINHETGHAFDHALGDFTNSADFQHAYDDDIAKMPAEDRVRLDSLVQAGAPGRKDTAAEVYGALNGRSANISQTPTILRDFPEVELYIKDKECSLLQAS